MPNEPYTINLLIVKDREVGCTSRIVNKRDQVTTMNVSCDAALLWLLKMRSAGVSIS